MIIVRQGERDRRKASWRKGNTITKLCRHSYASCMIAWRFQILACFQRPSCVDEL